MFIEQCNLVGRIIVNSLPQVVLQDILIFCFLKWSVQIILIFKKYRITIMEFNRKRKEKKL